MLKLTLISQNVGWFNKEQASFRGWQIRRRLSQRSSKTSRILDQRSSTLFATQGTKTCSFLQSQFLLNIYFYIFEKQAMVFFLPKLSWPILGEKNVLNSDWEKRSFEIRVWRLRICKIFEITRTIYSNSERSEQFLVTDENAFLTCSPGGFSYMII